MNIDWINTDKQGTKTKKRLGAVKLMHEYAGRLLLVFSGNYVLFGLINSRK